jgi:hypothetical protein
MRSRIEPASTIHPNWVPVNETLISPSSKATRTTHTRQSVLVTATTSRGMSEILLLRSVGSSMPDRTGGEHANKQQVSTLFSG